MKLIIVNETGHTELTVTEESAIEQINDHPTHWVFIDGVGNSMGWPLALGIQGVL